MLLHRLIRKICRHSFSIFFKVRQHPLRLRLPVQLLVTITDRHLCRLLSPLLALISPILADFILRNSKKALRMCLLLLASGIVTG
uniref:Spatula-like protein n=1 Tax=Capsicum annuum TaxID=4072 RepID=Q6RJZ4_CAPAN|nr:spatula-like protein [Capsicum annuum]